MNIEKKKFNDIYAEIVAENNEAAVKEKRSA